MKIRIKRSLIKGANPRYYLAFAFILTFLSTFACWLLSNAWMPVSLVVRLDESISWLALLLAGLVLCLLEIIPAKLHGPDELLKADFLENQLKLSVENKAWTIAYTDIDHVEKIMVMTRYNTEPGTYRLKIVRNNGRNLVFLSTDEEKAKSAQFEETEISKLYLAFKENKIKCN